MATRNMSYKGGTKRRVHRRRRTVRRGGNALVKGVSGFFGGIRNKLATMRMGSPSPSPAGAVQHAGKRSHKRRKTAKVKREETGIELVTGGRRSKRSGMTKKSAHKSKRREGVELQGGNCNNC